MSHNLSHEAKKSLEAETLRGHKKPSRLGPAELVLLAVTGAALIALALWAAQATTMSGLYADFGGRTPAATRFFTTRSALLIIMGALAASATAVAAFVRQRRVRVALLAAVAVLGVLAALATVLAIYLPIFQLADAIRAD